MPNYNPLNLTVNSEGRVSLWDSLEEAHKGMEVDESYVVLYLEPWQIEFILAAQKTSRNKRFTPPKHQFTISDY